MKRYNPSDNWENGFSGIGILIVVVIFLLIAAGGFFWIRSQETNQRLQYQLNQQTSRYAQPTIPVTDYAPGLPDGQKTVIIVRKSDSSEQKYLISNAMVAGFIKSLPAGDQVISQTPLAK